MCVRAIRLLAAVMLLGVLAVENATDAVSPTAAEASAATSPASA